MSRQPIESRPSTAQWLITAREAAGFTNAVDFLEAVKAAEGKAPSYSTYAQWESGSVTPRSSTLAPIRHFHQARLPQGTSAPAPVLSLEERAVIAAERQANALHMIAMAMISGRDPGPARPEIEAAFAAFLAQTEPRRPTADPVG